MSYFYRILRSVALTSLVSSSPNSHDGITLLGSSSVLLGTKLYCAPKSSSLCQTNRQLLIMLTVHQIFKFKSTQCVADGNLPILLASSEHLLLVLLFHEDRGEVNIQRSVGGELTDEMVPVRGRLGYALPIAAGLGIWPACLFEYGVVISNRID